MAKTNFTSLGLGSSKIASLGNRMHHKEAEKLFNQAFDSNVRVVDTSDTYGSGDSERMISRAINHMRDDFYVITKAGFPHMSLPSIFSPLNQVGKKVYQKLNFQQNFSKEYLINALQKSLKRLNMEYVDAFLLHEPNYIQLSKYPDFQVALEYIKNKGLAKNVGVSTNDKRVFELVCESGLVDIVQTALPYTNNDYNSVFHKSKAHGITTIANQIMQVRSVLYNNPKFILKLNSIGLGVEDIPAILVEFTLKIKKADCVLIGTTNPDHLKANASGLDRTLNLDFIFDEIMQITL